MTLESTEKLKIKCDNPECPGNTLNPEDRAGWLFVSSEFYGEPTQQHVFCSATCVSDATNNPEASFLARADD